MSKIKNIIFFIVSIIFLSFILIGGIVKLVCGNDIIDADLRSLLPESLSYSKDVANKINSELIFLLNAKNVDVNSNKLSSKTSEFISNLSNFSNLKVVAKINTDEIAKFYFDHRYVFQPPAYLNSTEQINDFVTDSVYSPFGGISGDEILYDPYMITRSNISNFSNNKFNIDSQGFIFIKKDNQVWYFVRAILEPEFSVLDRQNLYDFSLKWKEQLANDGIELNYTGAMFFAENSTRSSVKDMTLITIISSICLLIILYTVFRSYLSITTSFLVLSFSLFMGFMAVLLFWSYIHVISLALGASLIGICFDYILHMLMHRGFDNNKCSWFDSIKNIRVPLLFSLLTSVIAYLIMPMTDLIVLKQLSVFAIVSLISTYICVYFGVSRIVINKAKVPIFIEQIISKLDSIKSKYDKVFYVFFVTLWVLLGLITYYVFIYVNVDDDVSSMQRKDQFLVTQEKLIRNILLDDQQIAWYVISENSLEKTYEHCESIVSSIPQILNKNAVLPCLYVPSRQTQIKNSQTYQNNWSLLKSTYHNFDIELNREKSGVDHPNLIELNSDPFNLNSIFNENSMIIRVDQNNELVNNLLSNDPKVYKINQREEWSNAFALYHERMNVILIITVVLSTLICGIIMKKYVIRNYFLPITFGLFLSMVANYFITGYFNLFTTIACFMVIGLGTDYCIFLYNAEHNRKKQTLINVLIAWFTTECAIGLLPFSQIRIISSFGIVAAVGLSGILFSCIFLSHNESLRVEKK